MLVFRAASHSFFDTYYPLFQWNNLKSRFNIVFYIPMATVLDWDETFSMQANVLTPGSQRVVLSGFITERRPDGVYAAPLLPQLFYGADGTQLSSWSQNISGTGEQTILSRSGGLPTIPKDELYWRKVSGPTQPVAAQPVVPAASLTPTPFTLIPLLFLGVIVYFAIRKIKGGR